MIFLSYVMYVVALPVSFILGVLYWYGIRKLTARFQWRRGPLLTMHSDLKPVLGRTRILQPLYDIIKLLTKETIIPETANKTLFMLAPYITAVLAFSSVLFIPFLGFPLLSSNPYSLLIESYLLITTTLFIVLGASTSSSPWGALGARREAEMFLVYELAFVVSLFSSAIIHRSLSIYTIALNQSAWLPTIVLNPFAAALMIAALLGKLHLKPFDAPEAEAEIVAGPYTEYSGKLLGLLWMARAMILYATVTLFINMFIAPLYTLGVVASVPLYFVLAFIILFVLSLVHTINPRYRIDQTIRWYTKLVAVLGIISVALALMYLILGVG